MSNTAKKIPERKDVDAKFTWDLTQIFADDGEWEKAYATLSGFQSKIESFKGRLGESAKTLLEYCRLEDEISLAVEAVYGYSSLKGDEDTGNGFYQNMRGKAVGAYVAVQGAMSFSTPEILAISDEVLEQFYKDEPDLLTYKRSFDRIRRRKAHFLSKLFLST